MKPRFIGAILGATLFFAAACADATDLGAAIAQKGNGHGAAPCISCHGAKGEGNANAGFPRLAGLGNAYLARQIEAFARDERKNPVMAPMAKALGAPEIAAVASYFAQLPAPRATPSAADARSPGAKLAQEGRWIEANLPACVQCHGPNGAGVGDSFPPLQGQSAAYIAAQLRAWQQGARPPGPDGLMQAVAKKLSAADIDAVSAYFGSATPGAAPPATATQAPSSKSASPSAKGGATFTPPDESTIPGNDFGRLVHLGRQIFVDTGKSASPYVGNDLRCANCHLDAGRLAHSAPMWAAYVAYPQYRAKTKHVDSFPERLQGCFKYSMNGKAPALDSEPLAALVAYSYWMATGAPVNTKMEGAGYPKFRAPAAGGDYDRGARVYEERCALCHGANGEGQKSGAVQVFPPLWGARSFNWGAGMHQVTNAAAFIRANMPLGEGGTLTEQQSWDAAYFMDAHERPQDPRYQGSIAETRKKYHDSADSLYGVTIEGHLLGRGTGQ